MLKRIRKFIRWIKSPVFVYMPSTTTEALHGGLDEDMSPDQRRHAENMQNIALGNMSMQHNALEKSLTIQRQTMLVAIFAVIVTFAVSITAIIITVRSKPTVTVQPNISVKLDK